MRTGMGEKWQSTDQALQGTTALFSSVGNSQCAGLDTDLWDMGKAHNRERVSVETGVTGRVSPAPLCLTWRVML